MLSKITKQPANAPLADPTDFLFWQILNGAGSNFFDGAHGGNMGEPCLWLKSDLGSTLRKFPTSVGSRYQKLVTNASSGGVLA